MARIYRGRRLDQLWDQCSGVYTSLRPRDPAVKLTAAVGIDMRRIIQANIDRFKELLQTETDPTKRAMETRLLAEEEAKQKQLSPCDKNETKAY
jgi:hypothetical protein